jgi:hypothetical protein
VYSVRFDAAELWDGDTDCDASGVVPLAAGSDAESGSQSSVTARRSVSVDGKSVSLVVKLW